MEKNEIKKELYRNNPAAQFEYIRKGVAHYTAQLPTGTVRFEIPVSDMGDADFHPMMDSKHLIRWIA